MFIVSKPVGLQTLVDPEGVPGVGTPLSLESVVKIRF
jgi:hypothetical protein